jgi:K+-sensing histidine kinase KdpD
MFEGANYSEIIELADTLTYTSMELAKTDSMQKDVIANVSHDLRTPLTMVISYAEMIRDISGGDPEKRTEHLQVIIDEAGRLNLLVTDLLEVSRMQFGELQIEKQEFSLKTAIENILQSYTGFVEQEGYKLIFISRGVGRVVADEARIKQVISNLISNAIKYCGLDRTVEVRMTDEDGYVRCEISDHGIGIPKKDLRHIWERYYKASTNYQRSASSGLGLSIVKEILLMHGANFGVESALRKGSTFWFELKDTEVASADEISADETVPAIAGPDLTAASIGSEREAKAERDDDEDMTIAGKRISLSVTAGDGAGGGDAAAIKNMDFSARSESGTDDGDMIVIRDRASRKSAVGIYRDEAPDGAGGKGK